MRGVTQHILLVRHGQTDANATGILQGHLPTPLNRMGIRQAMLTADRLKGFRPPVEVLISSDLPRAVQTAGAIASACGVRVITNAAWRERGFGLLEGKMVGDRERWRAASGELDPPGAEATAAMLERSRVALLALPDQYPDAATIVVVAHGGPIRGLFRLMSESAIPTARGYRTEVPASIINGSIAHLMARKYRDGVRWRVVSVNESAHLGELVTARDVG